MLDQPRAGARRRLHAALSPDGFAGRLDERSIHSELLAGNPLNDPHERPLWIYVPPGYDDNGATTRYPTVYVLQSYTGYVAMWRNRLPFRRTFPEQADELMAQGACPPCILVFVDAWTSYGGSQFVDSHGTGQYHSYLCNEVVPYVDSHYRTLARASHRGIAGKSSGGFGAMITAMLRPDLFGGFASHAGDALYEVCYLPSFPKVVRVLRDSYGGSYERFWQDFERRTALARDDGELISTYGIAACFSTDDDGVVRLPFDIATARLIPEVWERWLTWDPVRMVAKHASALRGMRAIYLDAGRGDDYYLDLGAEAMLQELASVGVDDVYLELFDGAHSGIDHRYPIGLQYLAERLSD